MTRWKIELDASFPSYRSIRVSISKRCATMSGFFACFEWIGHSPDFLSLFSRVRSTFRVRLELLSFRYSFHRRASKLVARRYSPTCGNITCIGRRNFLFFSNKSNSLSRRARIQNIIHGLNSTSAPRVNYSRKQ